jgi:hypothetical protein
VERFDFGASCYMFYIGSGYVNLQRVQAGIGTTHIGQTQIPSMRDGNKVRMELRTNRDNATIALYVNGEQLAQWRDQAGFVSRGTGFCFFAQRMGPMMRLSNVKVSEWDGRDDTLVPETKPQDIQVVSLVNNDQAEGKLLSISQGRVSLQTDFAALKIPVERITDIYMRPGQPATNVLANEIRANFLGGGSVTFTAESWSKTKVSGMNRNFGHVSLNPAWIQLLQFNLNRAQELEQSGLLRKDANWIDE